MQNGTATMGDSLGVSYKASCQRLEEIKIAFSKWMDKQTLVHPFSEVLLNDKRKWAIKPWKTWESGAACC